MERIQQLLTLMDRLQAITEKDSGFLKKIQLKESRALHSQKIALGEEYLQALSTLASSPEIIQKTPETLRKIFKEKYKQLLACLTENEHLLEGMTKANTKIIEHLTTHVTGGKNKVISYTGKGVYAPQQAAPSMPLALRKTL